ncbi:cell division protein FtsL [Halalkalibacterium ligniniphilum]|uniref:cell division protein FtsL n=1 Tax=Halalkalibacterium ligniniphilum TaxID=1134413 RepID=UPI000349FD83|nr:cell division protein FtsL [Halalkalibacterium ligniniphilum]
MNVARQIGQEQEAKQVRRKSVRHIRKSITRGEQLIIGSMIVAAFFIFGLIIHNYASIYTVNNDIHQLESSIAQQTQVNDGLSLQVVELSRPERILHIATEKLGMTLDDEKVKVIQN